MSPSPAVPTQVSKNLHQSPIGALVSTWTRLGLHSLRSVHRDEADTHGDPPREGSAAALEQLLQEYFSTGWAAFEDLPLDQSGWTPFAQSVYRQCRKIPFGATVTYGELAKRAGNRSASRAVGALMARNRVLLVIPCHRVVAASGALRGFSAAGGLATKQYLLDLEAA